MGEADFGRYLRAARTHRGLTVRQLSVYSRVSSTYVSQLERGRKRQPSPAVLRKLASGLRLPYEELLAAAGYLPEEKESPSPAQVATREIAETLYALMEKLSPADRLSVKEHILGYLEVRFGADGRSRATDAGGGTASRPGGETGAEKQPGPRK